MEWKLFQTRTKYPTIKVIDGTNSFYMHSTYDPVREAIRWSESVNVDTEIIPHSIIIIGMGAGYHVQALLKKYPKYQFSVWDFNKSFASWANQECLHDWVNNYHNVTYRSTELLEEISRDFLPLISEPDVLLLIHPPSLRIIPKHLEKFRMILEEYLLFNRSLRNQKQKLTDNFMKNLLLNDPGISNWIGKYKQQPMLLISAGPSLSKQLNLLKEAKKGDAFILGSVGTALNPLLKNGIKPDFIMLSDAQDHIVNQIINHNCKSIPLFYLSTANHQAVKIYNGVRYIVWQKGFEMAEEQSKARTEPLIRTGGSVATSLLDLMVKMGAGPIALVGQDLSYTGGLTHASDTHNCKVINESTALIEIEDYYKQGTVKTSMNLYSYLRWFERYARDHNGQCQFWNCTEGGAYINGWFHRPLKEFIRRYS